MIKQVLKGQAGLLAVAAVTFCGATLYGAGKLLEYLFRDVDPEKLEESLKETEAKSSKTEEKGEKKMIDIYCYDR